MSKRLPIHINPERAVARGLEASGDFLLEKMDDLRDRLFAPYGKVSARFKFDKNGSRKRLTGHIVGEMIVECQRCMGGLKMPIDHHFQLGLIESEAEIDRLYPGEEPLMIGNEDLFLADIVEDELELLLPMVVMHDVGLCEQHVAPSVEKVPDELHVNSPVDESVIENKRPNPFAVLIDLKK
ncbi:MAG: YceD family protein [Gammaproteobacteria bacterium]|nr:YceD family protein [Gammaproteobacteria bacterium]